MEDKKSREHDADDEENKYRKKIKTDDRTCVNLVKKAMMFLIFIAGVIIITRRIGLFTYKAGAIDEIIHKMGLSEQNYAVVIDAGSTGSRILVPAFYKCRFTGSLKLRKDLFLENKPGLSAFVDTPEIAADKITELIKEALKFIPQSSWNSTPIALKATAGLRLLPPEKAEKLLNEVRDVINKSPFLKNGNSVSIMDGKDEGLFSWYTVNFLLDRLSLHLSDTVTTFDLGGGSIQITFAPSDKQTLKNKAEFSYPVTIANNKVNMYSYSYLGLGLMAMREKIFAFENEGAAEEAVLSSSCIYPSVSKQTFYHGKKKYEVSGLTNEGTDEVNFEKCTKVVKAVMKGEKVDKPAEILKRDVVAFSYFFDRAQECGLIGDVEGAMVTLIDFKNYAQKTCQKIVSDKRAFLCLDLIFITALLEDGFGFRETTPIMLLDTVDGHEISWALGAAFHILEEKH